MVLKSNKCHRINKNKNKDTFVLKKLYFEKCNEKIILDITIVNNSTFNGHVKNLIGKSRSKALWTIQNIYINQKRL